MRKFNITLLVFLFSLQAFADLNICPRMPVAAAVSNQFLTSISAAGATTLAQPAFSGISGTIALATQASGNLPVANLNSGTSASSSTFWRGDATWATPSGPTTIAVYYNGTVTGTLNGSANNVTWGTMVTDTNSAYSGGVFTVPVGGAGYYTIAVSAEATATSNNYVLLCLNIGVTQRNCGGWRGPVAVSASIFTTATWAGVFLSAGQLVTIKSNTNGTGGTWSSDFGGGVNYISIVRTGL